MAESKRFNVVDPTDGSNVFGGEVPLDALLMIYPMAPVMAEESFDRLAIGQACTAETLTPMRGGHGRYRVWRSR